MNAHLKDAVPNCIDGHLLHFSEGHYLAIYTRDGNFWVAEFREGRGELFNAATFFRFHADIFRYTNRAATLEAANALKPEVLERIEQLHRNREIRGRRLLDASIAVIRSVVRCCRGLTQMIRGHAANIAEGSK